MVQCIVQGGERGVFSIDAQTFFILVYRDHNVTGEIIPITLNYNYECSLSGNLNWYVGAGIALVDIEVDGPIFNDSDDLLPEKYLPIQSIQRGYTEGQTMPVVW